MIRRTASLTLATLVAFSSVQAASPADRQQEAREAILEIQQRLKLPSISVSIAVDGEMAFSQAFGWADLENRAPATPQTLYRLGSVSKLLTIAAVARLYLQGRIDLQAAPQQYVPGFPAKEHPFTVAQLAAHTAGIRHYRIGDPDGCSKEGRTSPDGDYKTMAEALKLFQDDPLLHQPGTAYQYSSFGYNLLGAVVEGASGKPFLDYMQDEVFAPLGLEHTAADRNLPIVAGRADFYLIHPETGQIGNAPCNDSSYKWPSAGFLSSSEDLVAFALAHLREGFFNSETLKIIFEPQPNAGRPGENGFQVGLGWRISKDAKGRTVYHHGGAILGGRAFLAVFPQRQAVVVMLSNAFANFAQPEAFRLAEIFLRD